MGIDRHITDTKKGNPNEDIERDLVSWTPHICDRIGDWTKDIYTRVAKKIRIVTWTRTSSATTRRS